MTTLRAGRRIPGFKRRMSLLSDPLAPQRITKSQSKSTFALPKLVSFDLWGTLFTPKAPIAEQYHRISNEEFGLSKSQDEIAADFPKIYKALEIKAPNYGKNSGYASSDEWWSEIITQVYQLPKEEASTKALCRRLIDHFKGAEAYKLYDDVIPVLKQLEERNIPFVGSSNSDHRVLSIMESLGIMDFFKGDRVNLSYDLGHAKPERQFYRSIVRKHFSGGSMTSFLENAWHVGDSYDKDFVGSVKSGWNGVLLDRTKSSVFFRNHQPTKQVTNDCFEGQSAESLDGENLVMISDNRVCVSGLQELMTLFK